MCWSCAGCPLIYRTIISIYKIYSINNLIELKASCRGINSPSPSALFELYLATEIPITFPNLSNKGPPLFPGEMDASA